MTPVFAVVADLLFWWRGDALDSYADYNQTADEL
jgi:hypothetical protein